MCSTCLSGCFEPLHPIPSTVLYYKWERSEWNGISVLFSWCALLRGLKSGQWGFIELLWKRTKSTISDISINFSQPIMIHNDYIKVIFHNSVIPFAWHVKYIINLHVWCTCVCSLPPVVYYSRNSLDQYSTYGNILLMQFSCVSQTRSVTPTVGLQWDDCLHSFTPVFYSFTRM